MDGPLREPPHVEGTTASFALQGDIDFVSSPVLRDTIVTLQQQGIDVLEIDVADVTFLDSVGLGVLLAARKRLSTEGGRLQLLNPSGHVLEVLKICGVEEYLTGAAS